MEVRTSCRKLPLSNGRPVFFEKLLGEVGNHYRRVAEVHFRSELSTVFLVRFFGTGGP